MNKRFWVMFATILIIIAAILTSCFIVSTDDDEIPAPSVLKGTASSTQYSISIPYIKDMEYANVLRQKCSNKDFIESAEVKIYTENIGQVTINSDSTTIPSFAFEDNYTKTKMYYRYAVRYYAGNSYTTTKYSTQKEGLGESEAELTSDEKLTVTYIPDTTAGTYELSVTPSITLPSEDFTNDGTFIEDGPEAVMLSIILNNGKISRPFHICKNQTELTLSNLVIPNLRVILTDDFLGVELTVKGFIAINKTTDTSNKYSRYYFSSLYENFSEKKFTVPSRDETTNDLDATAASILPIRAVLDIK